MNKTKLKVWSWIALLVGAVIGIGIVYSIEGMPVMPVVLGYIAYGIFLAIYLYFMGRSKMPDMDERTNYNARNFFAYGSTMMLFFIGFIIFVFYMFGYESVEVGMLAIFFSVAFAVLILGSYIARKL